VPEDHAGLEVLLVLGRSTGGIGRHVKSIAQGLPARGMTATICAPAATITGLGLAGGAARVVSAPIGELDPAALWAARRALRAEAVRADVVHAHGLRAAAAAIAFLPRTPLVVTWHNAPLGGRLWRLTHGALTRYVARSTDLTLAASDDLAAAARAAGAQRVRSTFVAAPEEAASGRSAAEIRQELGVGDRPLVLAVGRLQHQKRFDVLVEAAAGWGAAAGSPYVVIAGEGPARAELAGQIAATGAGVRLLGVRDDIADLLVAADVVALPSEWEARALVAQEALRAGVPLVTTGVGGLRALVGEAAVIVPVGDAAALRAAIEAIVTDDDHRSRLIAAGLAQASGWPDGRTGIEELAESYLDLISSVRPQ
jgi:glycosyltransferase involved in cell wall biosynthesis